MHKQHPQTAYRKDAVLTGTIFENCDKRKRNEKSETGIAALQQEATEEEVKGSGSVMSTFLADMHQLFTRHFLWMKS